MNFELKYDSFFGKFKDIYKHTFGKSAAQKLLRINQIAIYNYLFSNSVILAFDIYQAARLSVSLLPQMES